MKIRHIYSEILDLVANGPAPMVDRGIVCVTFERAKHSRASLFEADGWVHDSETTCF